MCKSSFRTAGILATMITVASCDPWFAYSPFEANVDERYLRNTEKNLALIEAQNTDDSKPFKVALLADTHYHFKNLDDAIIHVNRDGEYAFVIVTGDLTENGLKQEFIYFHESMSRLKAPYLTVIGNHDYLANGEQVYRQMFGPYNYSFVFNNVKFILFDNTTLESEKDPDFEWLKSEFDDNRVYDHVIPLAHIPPYDFQMINHNLVYHELMQKNNVHFSIHGHRHEFSVEDVYGDGVQYVTVSSPQKRSYTELVISPAMVSVRKIQY